MLKSWERCKLFSIIDDLKVSNSRNRVRLLNVTTMRAMTYGAKHDGAEVSGDAESDGCSEYEHIDITILTIKLFFR